MDNTTNQMQYNSYQKYGYHQFNILHLLALIVAICEICMRLEKEFCVFLPAVYSGKDGIKWIYDSLWKENTK